jgi:hypothetical protein
MKMSKCLHLFALLALLLLAGWSWRQPAAAVADRPVKVHIFYSSDALGYHEPCG